MPGSSADIPSWYTVSRVLLVHAVQAAPYIQPSRLWTLQRLNKPLPAVYLCTYFFPLKLVVTLP